MITISFVVTLAIVIFLWVVVILYGVGFLVWAVWNAVKDWYDDRQWKRRNRE